MGLEVSVACESASSVFVVSKLTEGYGINREKIPIDCVNLP